MPLFAEDLGDTLGRGADPESGHALELAAARFRPGAGALDAEGDWCYKDGRAPAGGTLALLMSTFMCNTFPLFLPCGGFNKDGACPRRGIQECKSPGLMFQHTACGM